VAGRLRRAERTSEETRQKLVDLRRRLEAAQQERARRIEYDAIAKTISRLPDRQKGKECVYFSSLSLSLSLALSPSWRRSLD
jgi:hypothetical protein